MQEMSGIKRFLYGFLVDGGSFYFCFLEWEASFDAGAGVADMSEPRGGKDGLVGLIFFEQFVWEAW